MAGGVESKLNSYNEEEIFHRRKKKEKHTNCTV